jgi:hypothetical protein
MLDRVLGSQTDAAYSSWGLTRDVYAFALMSVGQLLMTLMKLRLKCKDLDLAVGFNTSRATVSNIINNYISVLHKILLESILP